jgi:hypothetical protein
VVGFQRIGRQSNAIQREESVGLDQDTTQKSRRPLSETRFRVSTHGSEAQPGKAEFVRPEQFDFAPGRLHESNGLGVSIDRDAPSRRNREYVQAETGGRFVLVGENAAESLERSNRMGLV